MRAGVVREGFREEMRLKWTLTDWVAFGWAKQNNEDSDYKA